MEMTPKCHSAPLRGNLHPSNVYQSHRLQLREGGKKKLMAHLPAQRRPPCAFRLLVALGQCSVAGPQFLAGSVVNLHGDALRCTLLGEALSMARFPVARLPVAQEVFEPRKKLWEFPIRAAALEVTHHNSYCTISLMISLLMQELTQETG